MGMCRQIRNIYEDQSAVVEYDFQVTNSINNANEKRLSKYANNESL